jgi:hypothetical protein
MEKQLICEAIVIRRKNYTFCHLINICVQSQWSNKNDKLKMLFCTCMLSKSRHKAKRKTSDLEKNQSKQRYRYFDNKRGCSKEVTEIESII